MHNRLITSLLLVLALSCGFTAGVSAFESGGQELALAEAAEVESIDMNDGKLAMVEDEAVKQPSPEKGVKVSDPVILVPLVLAVLALVAVSRRREG